MLDKCNKNYVYIATTIDKYEYIIEIADSLNKLSEKLGLTKAAAYKQIKRLKNNPNLKKYSTYNVERVKIFDYVYIICRDIKQPRFVARNLKELAKISNLAYSTLTNTRIHREYLNNELKAITEKTEQLKFGCVVAVVDLLELDFELSEFLESCIGKTEITETFTPDI